MFAPPCSISATHCHGNYGSKLAHYFTEWHFSLPSISPTSTQFSAPALGSITKLPSHFLFSFSTPPHLHPLHFLRRPVICNSIYKNSLTEIITNNIQPATKSLLIIWSERHFNHKQFQQWKGSRKSWACRFWPVIALFSFNCIPHMSQ